MQRCHAQLERRMSEKDDNKSKLLPVWTPASVMTWEQTNKELKKISDQIRIIHNLPKLNGEKPGVYLHDALQGLRNRANELNWVRITLNAKSVKKAR